MKNQLPKNYLVPNVVVQTPNGERGYDIYSRLLEDRIVFLTGEVEENICASLVAQLLYLNSIDKEKPIFMYIDSCGGSCHSGLSVIDTMNKIEADVNTVVTGLAASMGAAIASNGVKRYALPNARIMVHQASSGTSGNVQDMKISFQSTEAVNDRLADIISKNCGMTKKKYLDETIRDKWLWPEEAIKFGEYGLIDEILPLKEIKREKKKKALK